MRYWNRLIPCLLDARIWSAIFLAHFSPALAAQPLVIKPPCLTPGELNQPRLDLLACSKVMRGPPSDRNGILDHIEQRTKNRVSCLYQGIFLDTYGTETPGQACPGTNMFGTDPKKPTCNLADLEGTPGNNVNHLGEDCGRPANHAGPGEWEDAAMRGLRIQGEKFFTNQVVQELATQGKLTISPSCDAMGREYAKLIVDGKLLSEGMTQGVTEIPQAIYDGGVNWCSTDSDLLKQLQDNEKSRPPHLRIPIPPLFIEQAQLIPKQGTCHLSVARESVRALFTYTAQCEISARLETFFGKFADAEAEKIRKAIEVCAHDATDHGQAVGDDKNSRSAGHRAGESYFDNCYDPKIRQFYQDVIDTYIPGKFSSAVRASGREYLV